MTPRVGLVGCGRWGRHILRDLRACGATVHVATPSASDGAAALAAGASTVHDDLGGLPEVDGYVVAAPSAVHAEVVERLLPSGRPVYVEKPMTTDAASARRLTRLGGDRLFVMQKWRYHPGIERMRQEIAAGRIGEVLAVRIQRWGWGNAHDDVSGLWILLPHDLSIVLHWLGDVPPLRSVTRTVPGAVDAGLIVQLGRAPGPLVTIDVSTTSPERRRGFSVVGSAGSMELVDGAAAVQVRRGAPAALDAAVESLAVGQQMPLLLEIRAFLDHLTGGPPPMSSAREGALIVERTAEIEAAAGARQRQGGGLFDKDGEQDGHG